jgi:hypothetical protein
MQTKDGKITGEDFKMLRSGKKKKDKKTINDDGST